METLQIRLPKTALQKIDREVRNGVYRSRSEAVRDALERIELLSVFGAFRSLIEEEGIDKKALLQGAAKIRGQLYKSYL
jgi:Arc/MetJ-type ribon-helix-helix transcriptional regulator